MRCLGRQAMPTQRALGVSASSATRLIGLGPARGLVHREGHQACVGEGHHAIFSTPHSARHL